MYDIVADLSTTEKMSGRFVEREGAQYYELEHFDLEISMEDFKFFADGIFPDPELSKFWMHTAMNITMYTICICFSSNGDHFHQLVLEVIVPDYSAADQADLGSDSRARIQQRTG